MVTIFTMSRNIFQAQDQYFQDFNYLKKLEMIYLIFNLLKTVNKLKNYLLKIL